MRVGPLLTIVHPPPDPETPEVALTGSACVVGCVPGRCACVRRERAERFTIGEHWR